MEVLIETGLDQRESVAEREDIWRCAYGMETSWIRCLLVSESSNVRLGFWDDVLSDGMVSSNYRTMQWEG